MCVKVPLELRRAHLRVLPLTLVATITATCRDSPMAPTACQESVAASLPTGDMFTQWGEHLGETTRHSAALSSPSSDSPETLALIFEFRVGVGAYLRVTEGVNGYRSDLCTG